jgi:hypothetical protein
VKIYKQHVSLADIAETLLREQLLRTNPEWSRLKSRLQSMTGIIIGLAPSSVIAKAAPFRGRAAIDR